jgi:hypothetical protein
VPANAVHQLAGELLRIVDAGGGEGEPAAIGPRVGDQLGGGAHRRGGCDHHHARHDADEGDGNKLARRIVAHLVLVEMLVDRDLARGRHQPRETVGRRLRDGCGGDHSACAGTVLDDDGLPERRLQRFGEEPRHDVHSAAGGIADEDADRPVGVAVLCPHATCAGDESKARARHDIPSGEHHSSPPQSSNRNADAARAKSAGPALNMTAALQHAAVQQHASHGTDHDSIQAGVRSRSARVQPGHGTFLSRVTLTVTPSTSH